MGAVEPANISIIPVGIIGDFTDSKELPFGKLVGIVL
jgi:hypothetical protein